MPDEEQTASAEVLRKNDDLHGGGLRIMIHIEPVAATEVGAVQVVMSCR